MGIGYGYGKVILFNEHFVVYGIPAIASAIDKKTIAEVKKCEGKDFIIHDDREATPGYKEEKLEQQKESIIRIKKAMGIDDCIEIWLHGDLKAASGVGASAASCAAIARAIADEFGLNLSDERINEIAYEGEKAYHGSPSGIDNTCATFGGLVWFIKGKGMERLQIEKPVEIVMGDTGIVANTKKAVAGVRERKEKYKEKYEQIFNEAEKLAYEAREALLKMDWEKVGQLMNKNHELLQQIEVSCKELDFLVEIARENGAYGAKMTGGGLGGYMVALTPGEELQEKVAKAIEKEGFYALRTKIGI
ncbi:MAG: mevalonate kinase [Thermoplasmata archaeon]|nr:MAG: mevalonate kinase [Thermoplasmata archaeon]RLF46701.1 MAG: mevalonate kinase [Thermoplasmata archaeon]